jgi:hypothetical protein
VTRLRTLSVPARYVIELACQEESSKYRNAKNSLPVKAILSRSCLFSRTLNSRSYLQPLTKKVSSLSSAYNPQRDIAWRLGAILTAQHNGKADLKAAMAYKRGKEAPNECVHYRPKGSWLITKCVVLDGFLAGSCSNFQYNEEQSRYSFRRG